MAERHAVRNEEKPPVCKAVNRRTGAVRRSCSRTFRTQTGVACNRAGGDFLSSCTSMLGDI